MFIRPFKTVYPVSETVYSICKFQFFHRNRYPFYFYGAAFSFGAWGDVYGVPLFTTVDARRACRHNAQNTVCVSFRHAINTAGICGINIYLSYRKNNIRKLLLYLHYRSVCAGFVRKTCFQVMTVHARVSPFVPAWREQRQDTRKPHNGIMDKKGSDNSRMSVNTA